MDEARQRHDAHADDVLVVRLQHGVALRAAVHRRRLVELDGRHGALVLRLRLGRENLGLPRTPEATIHFRVSFQRQNLKTKFGQRSTP